MFINIYCCKGRLRPWSYPNKHFDYTLSRLIDRFLHPLGVQEVTSWIMDHNRRTKARCRTVPNPQCRTGAHIVFTKICKCILHVKMKQMKNENEDEAYYMKCNPHKYVQLPDVFYRDVPHFILIMISLPWPPASVGIFDNPGWFITEFY